MLYFLTSLHGIETSIPFIVELEKERLEEPEY